MLVDLTISRWTAVKHDRAVSAEVDQTHAAIRAKTAYVARKLLEHMPQE